MKLDSESALQISRPIEVVFNAIVEREKLCKYFISESDGDLEEGVDLMWKFPEFAERFPITNVGIIENKEITFVWDPETVVRIDLEAYSKESTIVKVMESGKKFSEENLKWLISNVAGWANFLASMKAFLEYGIELRRGAYDFMRTGA